MTELQTIEQQDVLLTGDTVTPTETMPELEKMFDAARRKGLLENARVGYALQGVTKPTTETMVLLIERHAELVQTLEGLIGIFEKAEQITQPQTPGNELEA